MGKWTRLFPLLLVVAGLIVAGFWRWQRHQDGWDDLPRWRVDLPGGRYSVSNYDGVPMMVDTATGEVYLLEHREPGILGWNFQPGTDSNLTFDNRVRQQHLFELPKSSADKRGEK